MPLSLRAMVTSNPETLSDVLLAAQDRYREAEELLLAQCYDGCTYLLGYSTEMWLKAACLRLRGLGPSALVKSALPPLKKFMQQVAPTLQFTDYHNLAYMAECVHQMRVLQHRPLPQGLANELRQHVVAGMHDQWIVEMRYRRSGLTAADAWKALQNAWWVKTNWTSLA